MATQIKETPVLSGKDAERFLKAIKENESKKVPREDYDRAMEVYNEIMENSDI